MTARILLIGLLFLALSFSPGIAGGYPYQVSWSPEPITQGGIVRIEIRGPADLSRPEGTFGGKSLRFWHGSTRGTWLALAGVDVLAKPPMVPLVVTAAERKQWIEVPLQKGDFEIERLTLPKQQVTPTKPGILQRIRGDQKRAGDAGRHIEERPFDGVLQLPCEGRLNHNFGKRRILNGISKSPHGGEDISAPRGRPVRAAARGVVRLVDDMFYSGKTLFLDHGSGWMTTYFHLSEVLVKQGDEVEGGVEIGKVGSTGRATGPHLHWGLQWIRSRVDPLQLVPGQP